ncbi:S9 family peptidase [Agromyces sp. LHK192]|uniref:alpha/beta hydrolase family protein n=1 Tax=Agromyces sp. LHK192 TaxID=2498704 RepID=UPI000FDAB65E|nr:dipeptidyl aminopeptidase [Agromyces sp. LHK192]
MSKPSIAPFSSNPDFDYDIRGALGASVAGAGDPGEILAATGHVKKNDHEGWFAAWLALAERTSTAADASAEAGHRVSAASAYLRASAYFANAVNAASSLGDTARLATTFQRQHDAWQGFIEHTSVEVTAVQIPYEDDPLPGYLFRSATRAAAGNPVVVAVNGSDGSLAALWASCVSAGLERGYDVLVFDGPGQQTQLFEKGTHFRPDWEQVLTPVYDFVAAQDRVDADRISVYGISQGSYWVVRGIAFEHRFAAAITDPGLVDVSTSWTGHIPAGLLKHLAEGDLETFDKEMTLGMKFSPDTARTWTFRARPYGTTGYGETINAVRAYNATDVAGQITTKLLILSPENEQFWPGQAQKLAELTPDVSTTIAFTAAEGADEHCQPLARALTAERMYDWLDDQLGR